MTWRIALISPIIDGVVWVAVLVVVVIAGVA